MGKKIIIKGADFSDNGMAYAEVMYVNLYTTYPTETGSSATQSNGGWAFASYINNTPVPLAALVGKTVNFVRFKPKTAGTLKLYRCSDKSDVNTRVLVASFTIADGDVNEEKTFVFDPITLGEEYFIIGDNTSSGQGLPPYKSGLSGSYLVGKIPSSNTSNFNGGALIIDIGFMGYM